MYNLLIILLFLTVNISFASQWELIKNKDSIQVYTRDIPGSAISEFRGIVTISSSLDSILGVLDDIRACPEWVYQCAQPALINSLNFNERFVYQVNDFPFPARNRDTILNAQLRQDPQTKIITIKLQAYPGYCNNRDSAICKKINQSKLVRINKSSGYYQLEPLTNGQVKVTWQHHAEPGGDLPNWLVNNLITDTPFYTLKKLASIVKKEKYQNAKLKYNSKNIVEGFDVKNW